MRAQRGSACTFYNCMHRADGMGYPSMDRIGVGVVDHGRVKSHRIGRAACG